jgi:hypothetical protein
MKTTPEAFLKVIAPYRPDIVVAVECMFTWYWLADLYADEEIPFVLGHALYMKVIHGGKAKNTQARIIPFHSRLPGKRCDPISQNIQNRYFCPRPGTSKAL